MLHQGRIVVDIQQEEKQQLTVPQLLALFKQNSGTALKTIKYFYLHNQKEDGTKNERPPSSFSSFFRFCFMYQPLFLRKLFCSLLLPDRMDGKGA